MTARRVVFLSFHDGFTPTFYHDSMHRAARYLHISAERFPLQKGYKDVSFFSGEFSLMPPRFPPRLSFTLSSAAPSNRFQATSYHSMTRSSLQTKNTQQPLQYSKTGRTDHVDAYKNKNGDRRIAPSKQHDEHTANRCRTICNNKPLFATDTERNCCLQLFPWGSASGYPSNS